jgi:hypothetical protein
VLSSEDLKEEKQSLRHASFNIKKISKVITKEFLSKEIWEALSFSSSYLLKNIGTLLYDLLSEKSFGR